MAKSNRHTALDLTQEQILGSIHYDAESGKLFWRITRGRCIKGNEAGYIAHNGYRIVAINGGNYRAHHIIWFLETGSWPDRRYDTDHVNSLRDDNKFSNLRQATRSQNNANGKSRGGRSGLKGVHWCTRLNKWMATITHNYKGIYIGVYDDPREAHAAYCTMAARIYGEFARAG